MAEDPEKTSTENNDAAKPKGKGVDWLDVVKAFAMPVVTALLGFWINYSLDARQQQESNTRLYAEMMGQREQADSALRKDMFTSILNTFLTKDPKQSAPTPVDEDVLKLELLAYNFHESLDLGPLFKHVRRRIPTAGGEETKTALLKRLEGMAVEVNERQLTVLSDAGVVERGDASLEKVKDLQACRVWRPHG